MQEMAAAPPPQAGAADNDGDPEHPCPICLENEDDQASGQYIVTIMHAASSPGQQYTAGDCWVAMEEKIGRFDDCPMCRAPLRVPAKDKVERLLGLVARSPGGVCTRMARGAAGPADHAKAARLYHLAADQGLTRAQCGLGMIYQGVPQDVTEAVRLYRLAADQGGHAAAEQRDLGVMYKNGTGVPQDHADAVWLFTLARDQRFPPA